LRCERFQKDEEAPPEDFSPTGVPMLGPAGMEGYTPNRFKGDLEKLVRIYRFRTQYKGWANHSCPPSAEVTGQRNRPGTDSECGTDEHLRCCIQMN